MQMIKICLLTAITSAVIILFIYIILYLVDWSEFNQKRRADELVKIPFSAIKPLLTIKSKAVDFNRHHIHLYGCEEEYVFFKPTIKVTAVKLSLIDYIKYKRFYRNFEKKEAEQLTSDTLQDIIKSIEKELGLNNDKSLKDLERKYQEKETMEHKPRTMVIRGL